MKELRELKFEQLDDAVVEAESLLRGGYERRGNWTLGQICRHLRLVQDPSIDGYPKWMSAFAFLRPLMRRWMLPRIMKGDSPRGIRTARMFVPPQQLDDADEVAKFAGSVDRFSRHPGPFVPHPGFGRMNREDLARLHAAHAAHHLRFLDPDSSNASTSLLPGNVPPAG